MSFIDWNRKQPSQRAEKQKITERLATRCLYSQPPLPASQRKHRKHRKPTTHHNHTALHNTKAKRQISSMDNYNAIWLISDSNTNKSCRWKDAFLSLCILVMAQFNEPCEKCSTTPTTKPRMTAIQLTLSPLSLCLGLSLFLHLKLWCLFWQQWYNTLLHSVLAPKRHQQCTDKTNHR